MPGCDPPALDTGTTLRATLATDAAGMRDVAEPEPGRPRRRGRLSALTAAAILVVVGVGGIVLGNRASHPAAHRRLSTTEQRTTATRAASSTPILRPASDWQIRSAPGTRIEGYADRTSVLPGGRVRLYVSASAASFRVTSFRIGSYGTTPAAIAWQGGPFTTVRQPAATEIAATRTVTTAWHPEATVTTAGWQPGTYLLRLEGTDGAQSYVPLTIRSPSTAGRIVLIQAVTDWQAYNDWGGLSLYHGRDGRPVSRSYAVTFDRPYAEQAGAGDFLGNELPLVVFAESLHLPLAYATDADLHEDPHLLDGARAVVSPGHDEYYSTAMRRNVTAARDAGTNVLFLGANAIYRHIRLSATALGPDRLQTDYKVSELDPLTATDPRESTTQWRSPPLSQPESALIGGFYQCNPAQARLVVAPRLSWLTAGIGLHPGQVLGTLVGPEYDRVDLSVPTPHPLQVLFHSPLTCHKDHPFRDASDTTYYVAASGAGVFDAGTSKWVCALDDTACGPGWGDPASFAVIRTVTRRLLTAAAAGPLGRRHPAVDTTGGPPGPDDGIAGGTG
jgi:hypothetical protein